MGKKTILLLGIFFLLSTNVFAGFRCNRRVVDVGDNKLEVLRKCGEPTMKEIGGYKSKGVFRKNIYTGRVYWSREDLPVERWYYDRGRRSFMRVLTFIGGTLDKIELGDKAR